MRVNHNINSLNVYSRQINGPGEGTKALEKLSSGLRINKAGDDAMGLALSEKMRGQIRGLDQSNRSAQDAVSMVQTAEGALDKTHSTLQKMRELAVQASNSTTTEEDRDAIHEQLNQLISEVDRIANNTEFNGAKLLDGSLSANSSDSDGDRGLTVQVGANASQKINLNFRDMSAASLGLSNLTSSETADGAIEAIDNAIKNVSDERTRLDNITSQITRSMVDNGTAAEQLAASEARIKNVDMAKEMMEFTKQNIMNQAQQAMLAQANQQPQGVLLLLR